MRNKFLFLLSLTLFLFPGLLFSQPVDLQIIKAVALNANHVLRNEYNSKVKILEILPFLKEEPDVGYIINFDNNSFIILSGDYSIKPILGYSFEGVFDFTNAPPGLLHLIDRYSADILYSRNNNLKPSERINQSWIILTKNPKEYKSQFTKSSSVPPLLSTQWSQCSGFNYYCPYDEDSNCNDKCPAGCTAVALAQILRFWECQVNPTGSLYWTWSYYGTLYVNFGESTYDWVDMNDNYWDYENAWLIYSAGVGMTMKYGPNASTSTPGKAAESMETYWGFSNVDVRWRIWHLLTWKSDLKAELDAGRPLLYSAGNFALDGHSWVIDGYNTFDEFHCNWGWGPGWDGWFALGEFELGGSGLNQIESAIFDAFPDEPEGAPSPILTPQQIYAGSTEINLSPSFGATFYEWTTTEGTISATTDTPSNTITTNVNTQICIRSFNTLCDIYSDWDCEDFTITAGPITGENIVCSDQSESYYLNNCPPNAAISWSKSNNLNWVGTPSGVNCTVIATNSASGAAWIKATITNTDNYVFDVIKNFDWIGTPYVNPATIQFECAEGSGYLCANAFGNEFSFTFDHQYNYFDIKLTNLSETQTYDQFTIEDTWGTLDCSPPEGTHMFHVRGNNVCGTASDWTKRTVNFVDCGMGGLFSLDIYPNPTTEQATITIVTKEETNTVTNKVDEEWQLEVYTQGQLMKFSIPAIIDNKYVLNTSGWMPGMYFIRVYYKDEVLWGTLIVNE
ncbi:MAG: C10 family peptidase [Bacteroidota bacterium]